MDSIIYITLDQAKIIHQKTIQYSGGGTLTEDIIRLLARLEQQADSDVIDATTRHCHGDRKALAKEQAKKIAMGHKADDHEEGQKMN